VIAKNESSEKSKTVRFKIRRQDEPDGAPYWQEFEVEYRPNANVISCLQQIAADPITVDGQAAAIAIADGANSLLDIQDAINDAADNPGVQASIVTAADGAHLLISSTDTGASQEITITVSGGSGLEPFAFDPESGTNPMTELEAAADASVKIDGYTINSASNEISGAIQGLTLDLLKAGPGTTIPVSISRDEEGAKKAVSEFVTAYNSLILTISELTSYDAESETAGTLLGDSAVRGIKDALRRELSDTLSDTTAAFRTLSEIGITTKTDGNLELNAEDLSEALTQNFDAVGLVFATADEGVAIRLDTVLETVLSSSGAIENRELTLKDRIERVEEQRDKLDLRMESVRARYEAQFTAMDQLLSELSNTSAYLAQQLGA